MAYQGRLAGGLTVTVSQDGEQTTVTAEQAGQRQSSGSTTGPWTAAPKLWQVDSGGIVEIDGHSKTYLSISDGGVQSLERAPDWQDARAVDLSEVSDATAAAHLKPLRPLEPMQPMKPMKPLNGA